MSCGLEEHRGRMIGPAPRKVNSSHAFFGKLRQIWEMRFACSGMPTIAGRAMRPQMTPVGRR